MEHWIDRQGHEGNSEEKIQTDEGQEEEGSQQKEIGGMSNREEGEGEKENDKEHTTEQDTQWMEIEISSGGHGQGMEDQTKETDSEEVKMDNTGIDRGARGQLRTLKVKPNLENTRKKKMTRGRVKSVNGYEVLRGLEEEDG